MVSCGLPQAPDTVEELISPSWRAITRWCLRPGLRIANLDHRLANDAKKLSSRNV